MVLISIVTYNSAAYIIDCIKSILNQSYSDFILAIYDNNSQDNTIKFIESFQDTRIVIERGDVNIGFGGGHNYNIKTNASDYVLIINPDACIKNDFLFEAIAAISSDTTIGSIASLLVREEGGDLYVDCAGMEFTRSRRFLLRLNGRQMSDVQKSNYFVDGVDGAVAFYSRIAINDMLINDELYDSSYFLYGEDWDLAWRLQIAGWKCLFTRRCIGYHKREFRQRSLRSRLNIDSKIKYHSLKNSIISILKNDDKRNFLIDVRFIIGRFVNVIGFSLFFEPYSLKALFYIGQNWKMIKQKRVLVQAKRRVHASTFRNVFITGSPVLSTIQSEIG